VRHHPQRKGTVSDVCPESALSFLNILIHGQNKRFSIRFYLGANCRML
jgi:hypothetical protein